VPGTLHDVDFMVKDSKRFADSAGQGVGRADCRPRLVRLRGTAADVSDWRPEPPPNKALHLTGAAWLVSRALRALAAAPAA